MAFIPVPLTAQFNMQFMIAGQIVELTFGVRRVSDFMPADLANVADRFINWMNNSLKGILSNAISLVNVYGIALHSVTAPVVQRPVNPPIAGTVNVAALPNSTSAVATLNTALRGRSYRGRKYIIGIPANQQTSPVQLTPTYITSMLAAYNALGVELTSGSNEWVVVSRANGGVTRATGVTTPVTSFYADTYIDNQRRRLAGRGT